MFYFSITVTVPCENPTTCPEDFCTPPMITRCINFICLCDGPEYAEPEYDGPEPEYDHKGDFLSVKPKIINENMMMRERHMMKEIEV